MDEYYAVYIMSNRRRTVLYTGVTNNLIRRVWEHKNHFVAGFTKKYQCDDLVYYEFYETPLEAIEREKQIKGWTRDKKNKLVETLNSAAPGVFGMTLNLISRTILIIIYCYDILFLTTV